MPLLPLLATLQAAAAPIQRTFQYRILYKGKETGTCKVEVRTDGTFSGTSKSSSGNGSEATFSGKTQGSAIPEWTIRQRHSDVTVELAVDGTSGTYHRLDMKEKYPLLERAKIGPKFAMMAIYFNRTLYPLTEPGASQDLVDLLMVEFVSKLKVGPLGATERKVGRERVRVADLQVGKTQYRFAFDSKGECVGYIDPNQEYRVVEKGFEGVFRSREIEFPEGLPGLEH